MRVMLRRADSRASGRGRHGAARRFRDDPAAGRVGPPTHDNAAAASAVPFAGVRLEGADAALLAAERRERLGAPAHPPTRPYVCINESNGVYIFL